MLSLGTVGRAATRLLVAAAVFWGLSVGAIASTNQWVVASWNVENLYDTADDPANTGDDGYTPRGWSRWTEARYALKLQHLSDVLFAMRPDVVCLMEVENRRVLEDLSACLSNRHGYALPVIVHREGGDLRGIDVAVMAKTAPVATNWFCVVPGQRDVLVCDFVFCGRKLTVLANHWKSQLGKKAESDEIRTREALSVRAFLDRRLKDEPSAAILVAGDFNDTVTSRILTDVAGFALDVGQVRRDTSGRLLYNLSGGLAEAARGTYYYSPAKQWDAFDSMSVTRAMLDGMAPATALRVRLGSYGVFKQKEQCSLSGAPLPFRRVRSKEVGDVYLTGYSDHFPLRVELVCTPDAR